MSTSAGLPASLSAGRTAGRTVALAMIVRDEERCLARCLASVGDLVDEIVVVDTGSTDRTVAIARDHGARVVHEPWRDDFAAARNVALDNTSTDWVLMLDADEWLLPGAGTALAAVRRERERFVGEIDVVSTIGTRTMTGETGETTTRGRIPRLLPAGVRWTGRIHEQPAWDGPVRHTRIRVGHDGYSPALVGAKRGRNAVLLRAELAHHPEDPYLLLQLGRALESDADFVEAAQAYRGALALLPPTAPARHDLVVRMLFTLGQAGDTAEALDLAELEMPRWSMSPDFYFCLGDLLLTHGLAHPETTAEILPVIESSWLRCLEIGEKPDLVGAVAGRGSHLAAHNLAALYEAMGKASQAQRYQVLATQLRA